MKEDNPEIRFYNWLSKKECRKWFSQIRTIECSHGCWFTEFREYGIECPNLERLVLGDVDEFEEISDYFTDNDYSFPNLIAFETSDAHDELIEKC